MCQGGMEAPPAATRRANDGRSVEKPTMVAPCRIGEAAAPGRDSSSATHFRSVNFRTNAGQLGLVGVVLSASFVLVEGAEEAWCHGQGRSSRQRRSGWGIGSRSAR